MIPWTPPAVGGAGSVASDRFISALLEGNAYYCQGSTTDESISLHNPGGVTILVLGLFWDSVATPAASTDVFYGLDTAHVTGGTARTEVNMLTGANDAVGEVQSVNGTEVMATQLGSHSFYERSGALIRQSFGIVPVGLSAGDFFQATSTQGGYIGVYWIEI